MAFNINVIDQSSVDGFITFSVTFKYINMVHNEILNGAQNASQTASPF